MVKTMQLVCVQEKRRRGRDKRYRDKQGFVWRRMVPDEELPVPRAPQPHLPSQLPPPRPAAQQPPRQPNIKYISQVGRLGGVFRFIDEGRGAVDLMQIFPLNFALQMFRRLVVKN